MFEPNPENAISMQTEGCKVPGRRTKIWKNPF